MKKRLLGESHPSIATTLHTYAAMLSRQGRHAESIARYERALEMKRSWHGRESLEALECLDDYASCLVRAGRLEEAETRLRDVVAMTEKLLGSGRSAAPLARLAWCERLLERPREARRLYCESLRRYYVMLSAHPQVLGPDVKQFLLKSNEASTEEEEKALEQELLAVLRKTPTNAHISASTVSDILIGFAVTLAENGELEAAATVAQEAHRLREDTLPAGHWHVAESQAALGYVLALRGDEPRGTTLLADAVVKLEAARGVDAPPTTSARAYLERVSRGVGAPTGRRAESRTP